jgi:hypothetical protein
MKCNNNVCYVFVCYNLIKFYIFDNQFFNSQSIPFKTPPMKKPNLLLILILLPYSLAAQFWAEVEAGAVATAYNDVRIPGSSGTFFSLLDDLGGENELFYRLRAGYRLGKRSEVLVLYAPLTMNYTGTFQQPVVFFGENFPANQPIDATYKFNSYRGTYRYYIKPEGRLVAALGLTVKVRDALIGLYSGNLAAERTDLGPVPLINFLAHWKPHAKLGLLLEGDALAAPSGRAEDVMVAVTWQLLPGITLHGGYRLLEGGADNSKVYTFSMFHYGVVGLMIQL